MASTKRKRNKGHAKLSFMDLVSTGPGTLAGIHAHVLASIYRAEELVPGSARPIRIMGEDFTLTAGQAGRPSRGISLCPSGNSVIRWLG
jgi:hypothetical protein